MSLFIPNLFAKNFAEPAKAQALGASATEIEELAGECLRQMELDRGGDLTAAVSRLGGRVSTMRSFGGGGSKLEAIGNEFVIEIFDHTHPRRDRFEIAHGLGHWVMHYLIPNQRDQVGIAWLRVPQYEDSPANSEANRFAFAFLMPADEIREFAATVSDTDRLTHAISDEFNVTGQAAHLRLLGLGLVKAPTPA